MRMVPDPQRETMSEPIKIILREEQIPFLAALHRLTLSEVRVIALDVGYTIGIPAEPDTEGGRRLGSSRQTALPGSTAFPCSGCGTPTYFSDPPTEGELLVCEKCLPDADATLAMAKELCTRLRRLGIQKLTKPFLMRESQ